MSRELIHPCPHAGERDLMESCPCGYKAQRESDGCWIAYYHDGSGFVPFATELEALRHALGYGMAVKFARFGDEDWKVRADLRTETAGHECPEVECPPRAAFPADDDPGPLR